MCAIVLRRLVVVTLLGTVICGPTPGRAADLSADKVLKSIERAKRFLVSRQNQNGSWTTGDQNRYRDECEWTHHQK